MYYLDLFQLYKDTPKSQRSIVRTTLDRNKAMGYKLRKQKNKCFFCGCEITIADHLDHLIPVYKGGSNRSRNLVASCKQCNLTKSISQIEITNEMTIKDYKNLQKSFLRLDGRKYAYKDKRYRLYKIYRADLFREA